MSAVTVDIVKEVAAEQIKALCKLSLHPDANHAALIKRAYDLGHAAGQCAGVKEMADAVHKTLDNLK